MGEEIADLGERPVEADDLDDLGVFGGDFKALDQCGRQSGTAHGSEALDLFQRQHGHQAGHDRDVDSGRAALFNEAVVNGVVEKELRGDEGGTGIDFAFQGVEVGCERGGLGVFFRITAYA